MTICRGNAGLILERQSWTFAKTMPQIPHFWSHMRSWDNPEEFRAAVDAIFEHGRLERFRHFKPKKYFYAGGWRYWVMDPRPEDVTLINRCDPNHPRLKPHIHVVTE